MASLDTFPDIKRITQANRQLVETAKSLLALSEEADAPRLNAALRRAVQEIATASGEIDAAIGGVIRAARQ